MTKSMIRSGLMIIAFGALAAQALAAEGAYRRTCRINGGQAWDIQIPGDQITLCRFGGVGFATDTYYSAKVERQRPEAVAAFLAGPTSCDQAGGSEIDATDLEGVSVTICRFADGSIIESAALEQGPGGASSLSRALR